MMTWDDVQLTISPDLRDELTANPDLYAKPGIQAMLDFSERFFHTLCDPPETGRFVFGTIMIPEDGVTRLIRAFRVSPNMDCFISYNEQYRGLYDVFFAIPGNDKIDSCSIIFFFRADSADPVSPPSV